MAEEAAHALVATLMKRKKPYWIKRFDQRGRGQYCARFYSAGHSKLLRQASTPRRESWPRSWVGDADERHFLSAFSKKPGRQPGLRRTLKFGAGQFRRPG